MGLVYDEKVVFFVINLVVISDAWSSRNSKFGGCNKRR